MPKPPVPHFADGAAFRATLTDGAATLGLTVSDTQVDSLERLTAWLLDWNQRMNLTAVREPREVAIKHILDSMTLLVAHSFLEGARVLDVGTGAGFPGLVLKVLRPDLDVTMLDSTRKKLAFVEFVLGQMGWSGAGVLSGRAEELGHNPACREAFDVVVARAVAAMRILCEFCLPFARVGGIFLAMKGPNIADELGAALPAITRLGGEAEDLIPFSLPFEGGERAVLPIAKVRPTPAAYPRIFRDIKRQPL